MPEETSSSAPISNSPRRAVRVLAAVAAVVLIPIMIGGLILAIKWPFRQRDVIQALEERVGGTVVAQEFHGSFFPHPGCVLRGVIVTRGDGERGAPPFATAGKLTVNANYFDLFLHPGYIRLIFIDELAIQLLPRKSWSAGEDSSSDGKTSNKSKMWAGSVVVQNARLRIDRRDGKKPLDFAIHSLVLGSVASDRQITYSVEMTNALPPGELSAKGKFGPWDSQNFKETPLSGESVLQGVNLDVFPSISGTLSSDNQFDGILERIAISGSADVPNFHLKSASHTVHVRAPFRAVVNGTTGDVALNVAKAQVQRTIIDVKGAIAGHTGRPGKVTEIDFSTENGDIEDVLDLFVKRPEAPIRGVTRFQGHATIRAFGGSFLKKTSLDGTFEIKSVQFSNRKTQNNIDMLSARSRGEKQASTPPQHVLCDFRGRLDMQDGKARFSRISVSVPGAEADLQGVYNLTNDRIDFHGTLATQTELSKTTHGIKSILLKPLDPFFKKKNAGAVIPVEMVGTYDQPHFGIELAGKGQHGDSQSH